MFDDGNFFFECLTPIDIGKTNPMRRGNDTPLAKAHGAGRFSGNIYFYWFNFLKLYLRYRELAQIAPSANETEILTDFDIDLSEDFEAWWKRIGSWLFSDKFEEESDVKHIKTRQDIADLKDGIAFFFPFDGNLSDMLKQAEASFKFARETFYKRRPDLRKKYGLETRSYDIEGLHNKRIVYDAVMKAPATETFAVIFDRIHSELILQRPVKYMTPDDINDFMSGHFDGACRLIYHLMRGKFPVYTKPQGRYNPRKDKAKSK